MYFILIQINSKTSNLEKQTKQIKKKQQQKLVIFVTYIKSLTCIPFFWNFYFS